MNSYQIILLIIMVVIITLLFVYGRNLANTFTATYGGIGSFQKMTVIITLIILLVILIFIWGSLSYAKNDKNIPIVAQCPDFWEIGGTVESPTCVNVQDLGTCPAASGDEHLSVDFNSGNFTDNCAKYTWANNCNIAWDGLTYGVDNPCATTASIAATASAATAAATATSKTIA